MNGLMVAMRASRYLPRSAVRGAAWAGANLGWLRNGKSTRRLSDNLARVTGLDGKELRRLTRKGMVSSARYYSEVLEMPRITDDQIRARLRIVDETGAVEAIHAARGAVIALGHSGNWDLVGYRTALDIAALTSVAEVLEPRELFDEFVALRARIGIRIYGHEGSATFRELLREAKADEERILALVSDRDLSGSGVEVSMWGHRVKVAPGPAALSLASGLPLICVTSYYERLRGAKRRAGRTKWGAVLEFGPILYPADFAGSDGVARMTQAWAEWLAVQIAAHPEDWHMLQRFGWVE
jgi:KDO2-lipid IV(A) lauroyltransferase